MTVTLLAEIGHNRGSFIAGQVAKHHKALEVGGSYNPMFRRSEGYDLWTADHDTQENLSARYAAAGVQGSDRIERADFVATDGNLDKSIPDVHAGTFDFVLSSHNIEHIPNPIAHLKSIDRLLSSSGKFLMVVPDKRGCFDLLRPLTTTGQWLEAYLRPEQFHSPRARFDCESYAVANRREITWSNDTIFDGLEIASGIGVRTSFEHIASPATTYWDGHAWTFTPHAMLLVLREVHALQLTTLYPNKILSDGNGEFVVEMTRKEPSLISNDERVRLLALACREQAEAHMRINVT